MNHPYREEKGGSGVIGLLAWGLACGVVCAAAAFALNGAWWGVALSYALGGSAGMLLAGLATLMRQEPAEPSAARRRSAGTARRAPT